VAAIQDEFADASVGNVTGSNAVNVFLGIGIAWTIAAIYHKLIKTVTPGLCESECTREISRSWANCQFFHVDPGSLAYSVTLFCACAVVAISVMLLRRLQSFGGGELGGPARFKYPTAILFVALWIFYVVMSSLEAYEIIEGF
jgi:solute carrier family 8 (sodium/calcium exchanger)